MASAHGERVAVVGNNAELLARFSPTGTWRRGAFEVVRTDTGQLLYSKVQTGQHLADDAAKLEAFVASLAVE